MPTEEQKPTRTNAEQAAAEDRTAVPYSTDYGEPEPEFVGRQPNRYPDKSAPDAQFVAKQERWTPDMDGTADAATGQNRQNGALSADGQRGLTLDFVRGLAKANDQKSKIVLLVMDGLGGHPQREGGKTELETAHTPNLDALAAQGICGLQQPVASGITSGSGPGHLALFGYDPFTYQIGRGALSALGIDFDLQSTDVAARGNFCTVDGDGLVTDRRAGRISSEEGRKLCELLDQIVIDGVDVTVRHVEEYRFVLVLRGDNLSADLSDTDPQATGVKPQSAEAKAAGAEQTARYVTQFLEQAKTLLADHEPANMVLLRGFAQRPNWPSLTDAFHLRAAAIASYPMYRGVARLLGMERLQTTEDIAAKIGVLAEHWSNYDFFFVHVKRTDSAGEDGDFQRKVQLIEEVDLHIPRLLSLNPDVLIVTGDHSTPAIMQSHSWHPVPVVLWSKICRPDEVQRFGERPCIAGALGPRFPAAELMTLALANAQRLEKFGA
ncbi:MAG TPA: 2,3-bisphosphoglycerate-independent phosphoglycerate mutase [Caldilineaceae bacterium]|nr:2,3-bisphosphoglycerate-independent phosphoglycerate mutase [Caldilineaceae bacterium]